MNIKTPFNWAYSNFMEILEPGRLKQLYGLFVQKDDIVFDLGANIGEHTKIFEFLGCKTISVEPNKDLIESIRYYQRNNKKSRVICAGVDAIGNGTVKRLNAFNDDAHNTFLINSPKVSRQKEVGYSDVSMVTLSELMEKYGTPKFIKIDVEGYEWEVIKTLDKPVPFLCFEFSDSLRETTEKCIDFLEKKGYEFNYSISIYHKLWDGDWLDSYWIRRHLDEPRKNNFGMIYARLKNEN